MSGKVQDYTHFGVTLKNEQWSWSGRTPDGRVVLSIWKDQIDYRTKPPRYNLFDHPRLSVWIDKPGNHERIENLKWARDKCEGKFHVVIITAKNTTVEPRKIDEAYPTKLIMRLSDFDENTGEFTPRFWTITIPSGESLTESTEH